MPPRSASCRIGFAASLAALALLGGCATSADPYAADPASRLLSQSDALGDCMRRLRAVDARVDAAGLRDAEAARVDGYPFLRVDRYTAFGSSGPADPQAMAQAKIDRMAALDAQARSFEAANARVGKEEQAALDACRDQLVAVARAEAQRVMQVAQPPDAYSDAGRVLGLYPLTQIPFSWGVAGWQQATRELYATPFPEVPVRGERIRYVPADGIPDRVAGQLPEDAAAAKIFGLPAITPARTRQLLQQHAPVLVVDTVDDNDRIGRLAWRMSGRDLLVVVDIATPATYARVAGTGIGGAPALQLVYTFWFPARPAAHPLDLVAGRLDALVWRVTLDAEGRPLVYDSIHACGCFHMFFPTERVRERPGPHEHERALDETMFSPQVVRGPGAGERVILYVGSGDHNIQRVAIDSPTPAPGVPYRIVDENTLRALPMPAAAGGGTRSIYGPDALVPGSQRPERFIFWPMGVPSAGQMRQWGHHATAFIGRRHFDDPRLIDRYFSVAPGAD
jgi:hypothetical protein